MLLFFDLGIAGMTLCGVASMTSACTAIPLTRWDVPAPLTVSSSLSILSQARVVKTFG